jgi:hypothetical protein
MYFQLWRSLAATLSRLVLKFVVALSYAIGFNAMLFLPLYEVRAQSPLAAAMHSPWYAILIRGRSRRNRSSIIPAARRY